MRVVPITIVHTPLHVVSLLFVYHLYHFGSLICSFRLPLCFKFVCFKHFCLELYRNELILCRLSHSHSLFSRSPDMSDRFPAPPVMMFFVLRTNCPLVNHLLIHNFSVHTRHRSEWSKNSTMSSCRSIFTRLECLHPKFRKTLTIGTYFFTKFYQFSQFNKSAIGLNPFNLL